MNLTPLRLAGEAVVQLKTIYTGDRTEPYMTRLLLGRLRLHVFHRGDEDPDPHNHPFDFWTFPLTGYVEQVTRVVTRVVLVGGEYDVREVLEVRSQVVTPFRLHFRRAGHTHRVIGRWSGIRSWGGLPIAHVARGSEHWVPDGFGGRYLRTRPRKIVTIVWRGPHSQEWGFLKSRDGRWCWVAWRDYIFVGGKDAPCNDT